MMKLFVSLFSLCFFFTNAALAAPHSMVVEGNLYDSADQPVEDSSVVFTLEVLSPGAESCLLYEETHTVNMSNSGGYFQVSLGAGSRSGSDYEDTNTLINAFDNSIGLISPTTCAAVGTYTPVLTDSRKLRLSYQIGGGAIQTLVQDIDIRSSAFALSARSVGGLQASDILPLAGGSMTGPLAMGAYKITGSYTPSAGDDLTNKNYVDAQIAGVSGVSTTGGSMTGALDITGSTDSVQLEVQAHSTQTTNQNFVEFKDSAGAVIASVRFDGIPTNATDLTTKDYVDTYVSTQISGIPADPNKLNLSGGTMTGQLFIDGGSDDVQFRIDADASQSANLLEIRNSGGTNLAFFDNTGGLSVPAIGTNAILSDGNIIIKTQNALQLNDLTNSGNVKIKAPTSIATNYSLILPADDGNPSQVLSTDGSGALSWVAQSGGDDLGNHTATQDINLGGNEILDLSLGSETAPSLSFSGGDTNTGIFSPAGDTLSFSTAGNEALTIDSSGRVGIGTSSPAAELDVDGTGAIIVPQGTLAQRPGGENGMIRYNSDNNKMEAYENGSWMDLIDTNIDHNALTNFVANEHVDHSAVAINTTSGSSGLSGGGDLTTTRNIAIDIAGTTDVATAQDADTLLIRDDDDSGKLKEISRANFLSGYLTNSTGSVGTNEIANNTIKVEDLNAAAPTSTYVLTATSATTMAWQPLPPDTLGNHMATTALNLNNNKLTNLAQGNASLPSLSFDTDSGTGIFSPGAGELAFSSNTSEVLRIASNGKVGIGTGAPSHHLELFASTGTANSFLVNNPSGNKALDIKYISGDPKVGIGTDAPTGEATMVIKGDDDATNQAILEVRKGNNTPIFRILEDMRVSIDGSLNVTGEITGVVHSDLIAEGSNNMDFALTNMGYTTSSCGNFNLNNLKDGVYYFHVQGTTSFTCSFSAYSGNGVSPLTVLFPGSVPTTATKTTLFTIRVFGSYALISQESF